MGQEHQIGHGPRSVPDRWSKATIAAVVIVAIGLIGALAIGAVVLVFMGRTYPSEWDPKVADLASFVERERDLTFDHPVHVDFMSEDDFKQQVSTPSSAPSEEQNEELARTVQLYRALGLLQGDINLLEQRNQLRQGGTLALYDPRTKRVRVRGTELDVAHKVTIVHELTHAVQDQHFDLTRLSKLPTDDERSALRTVVEGDAVRVERKYLDQLPAPARQAYEDQERRDGDQARKAVSSVPDVLVASFTAPYAFGTPFLEALEAKGGTREVNQAIDSPPKGAGQIIDPLDYFDKREVGVVQAPDLPPGAERIPISGDEDDGDGVDHLGVLTFFMMLSARVDPHQALAAADRWKGDAMVLFRQNGRLCAKVAVVFDDGIAADKVAPMLGAWSQNMVADARSTVDRAGDKFILTSCDPGPAADAAIQGTPSKVFSLPASRLYVFARAVESDLPLALADCVSKHFGENLTLEEATSDAPDPGAIKEKVAVARDACR